MVIPNHGMTKYGDVNKRGDLVIRFNVIFPMAVDSRSRMIISEALDDDSD